ncbi:MAG: hypothetical protein ACLPIC_12840 [Rhodoblastus sp.]|uniref:hypothetical protein n=1 Tax=Rhodoblastus sp. TaxID=1962975 RepID=UPI003F9D18EA
MVGMIDLTKAVLAGVRRATAFWGAAPSALLLALVVNCGVADKAAAIPAFARQTGQTCSTCHTAFPQLTPFGRRFKLGGYTAGGGDTKDLPQLSFMLQSGYTHYNVGLTAPTGNYSSPPGGGFNGVNNYVDLAQQIAIFYGGRIYGNLGGMLQATFSNSSSRDFAIDNSDIRYADSFKFYNHDVLWGLTANDVPTMQDVWNTTPVWSSPFITSAFSLSPVANTMIQSFGPGQTLGGGGYLFLNDTWYAELSAYGSLTPKAQLTLGIPGSSVGPAISGLAPYYRVAMEQNWGDHSFMIGAYGMNANVTPAYSYGFGTDNMYDAGFDSQYQWITDVHAVTIRANYIWERQLLNSSFAQGFSANPTDYLRSLKIGAEYVYNNTYAFTATYFQITGSPDAVIFSQNAFMSPNSSGWIFDLAYLPFSHGGPDLWPWFNTRLGVSYTLFTKFDGSATNIDPTNCPYCRNANNNNTLFVYALSMF